MAVAPLFFLLLTTHIASARVLPSPATAETSPADNRTIYNTSSQFCLGCIAESMEFLLSHNWARAQHLELPLIWDFEVEKYARWWAGERKSDCKLQHSFDNGTFVMGENIFWGSGSGWTPRDAVRAWVDEQKYYSYSGNQCLGGHVCGHYTQVVWRETRRLGCARVVCDTGDVFMTCNYDPPGNYIGQRPY
ncbi:Glioma pathogenesis-related protein 1 [Nymphaea thermarum]|nr:Glioma pathogenesis-related protein 1 [Nymphaea thermarum]